MPIYTLEQVKIPDLLPMEGRSRNIHVSDVIRDLCIKLGHFKDTGKPIDMTRAQLGQAMEEAIMERYRRHHPDRFHRGGEVTKDGMSGTCDMLDQLEWSIHEMKLTWMSARHCEDPASKKLWKYWVQLMAYCYLWETAIGHLHVVCVNGKYSYDDDDGPQYFHWKAEFSRKELEANWKMLIDHEKAMRKESRSRGRSKR